MELGRTLPERDLQTDCAQLRRLNLPTLAGFLEKEGPTTLCGTFARVVADKAAFCEAAERSVGVLLDEEDRSTMGDEARVETGGTKHDGGKPRFDLIPTYPLEAAAAVFRFGAEKYDDRNWEKGITFGRLYGALQRHLNAWWRGEELDPESGMSHLGHANCCLMMLTELHLNPNYKALDVSQFEGRVEDYGSIGQDGSELDDRP